MHFEANSSFQNKQITKRETLSIETKASRAIKKVFPAGAFKLLKGKKKGRVKTLAPGFQASCQLLAAALTL